MSEQERGKAHGKADSVGWDSQALMQRLKRNQQTGSKPRCHWLTHGSAAQVAERLSALIAPWGRVEETAVCLPKGFDDVTEAQLHKPTGLVPEQTRLALSNWWLGRDDAFLRTPHWDIATTCTVGGNTNGVLLIEAKAHTSELVGASAGRAQSLPVTEDAERSAARIGACIDEASAALTADTGLPWSLSRDRNYQMSNRFAWAWKLAELGHPVILVYLGFLGAKEMVQKNSSAFDSHGTWENLVRTESKNLFPTEVWNRAWEVGGVPIIPLIRAVDQSCDGS